MPAYDLHEVGENVWEIPATFRPDMRVPARLYADYDLLQKASADQSLEQLINTTTLPGIVEHALAMPDIHQGYGFPIGGIVATALPRGVISPGGVGYDINCGVRLLASGLTVDQIQPYLEELATSLYKNCPSGVGARGDIRLKDSEFDRVLRTGSEWGLEQGYARREDVEFTEEGGRIDDSDPTWVSARARDRGRNQIGTLGAGNHFIEVDMVAEIFHPVCSEALGLFQDQVVVQIHCGSRGLGHQVCQDFVSQYQSYVQQHKIELPDRELVFAPLDSPEGQEYFCAMACAANFAFANRQVLTHKIRRSFEQVLAGRLTDFDLKQVYDVAHNMAKLEDHTVQGCTLKLCVHRKGATRAFGPGTPGLPVAFRDIGQPVLIPGSMGTGSFVLLGTKKSMEQTFGSTCHGAGRLLSRMKAKKMIRGEQLRTRLRERGILVRSASMADLAEEAPEAYKDINRVVDVVAQAGIAKKIARLQPIAVIKG